LFGVGKKLNGNFCFCTQIQGKKRFNEGSQNPNSNLIFRGDSSTSYLEGVDFTVAKKKLEKVNKRITSPNFFHVWRSRKL